MDKSTPTPQAGPPPSLPRTDAQDPAPASGPAPGPATTTSGSPAATPSKPIHALVLDSGPLIRNDIAASTLLAEAEELYTIPSVVSEIRDEATRSRFQTTLQPFLKLRTPRPASIQFVTGFARRTGDLEVLSTPDVHLLALTYELECERNGGDWRLRREPKQGTLNGAPPRKEGQAGDSADGASKEVGQAMGAGEKTETTPDRGASPEAVSKWHAEDEPDGEREAVEASLDPQTPKSAQTSATPAEEPEKQLARLSLETSRVVDPAATAQHGSVRLEDGDQDGDDDEDDEDGEWITPSNIKRHKARENTSAVPEPIQRVLRAALLTTDNAMRNVALRINLNLLDSSCQRITTLKSWVLRCHGCFQVCKNLARQFCPNCGQATLTRVSCSTNAAGNFTLHLKQNFQWNKRGNVYSIPKPTHGSASGKQAHVRGGGKKGWGAELILAEDQKEYTRKAEEDRRTRYRDLMDEDYLPGILSGERKGGHGRIRVGAGRNVNARKR